MLSLDVEGSTFVLLGSVWVDVCRLSLTHSHPHTGEWITVGRAELQHPQGSYGDDAKQRSHIRREFEEAMKGRRQPAISLGTQSKPLSDWHTAQPGGAATSNKLPKNACESESQSVSQAGSQLRT